MDREASIREALAEFETLSIEPLRGGMSAELFAVDVLSSDGVPSRLVVRFPSAYVRTMFEDAALQEFRVLEAVVKAGLPAPKPLRLGDAPDGHFLILSYLPGVATAQPTDVHSYLGRMAESLARIHATSLADGSFDFLMRMRTVLPPPSPPMNEDLLEPEIVAALQGFEAIPMPDEVLRHGDFWPGNLLWEDGHLTGIIDWENALLGPSIADVSISRLDVYWILGKEAMDEFTQRYVEASGSSLEAMAYWDLRACRRPIKNLPEWVGPYVSLDRPDMTYEGMRDVLLEFAEDALSRVKG